jgi:hypothetical protein
MMGLERRFDGLRGTQDVLAAARRTTQSPVESPVAALRFLETAVSGAFGTGLLGLTRSGIAVGIEVEGQVVHGATSTRSRSTTSLTGYAMRGIALTARRYWCRLM